MGPTERVPAGATRAEIRAALVENFRTHHVRLSERRTVQRKVAGAGAFAAIAAVVLGFVFVKAGPVPRAVEIVRGPVAEVERPHCRVMTVGNEVGIVERMSVRSTTTVRVMTDSDLILGLSERCGSVGLVRVGSSVKVLASCDLVPADARLEIR